MSQKYCIRQVLKTINISSREVFRTALSLTWINFNPSMPNNVCDKITYPFQILTVQTGYVIHPILYNGWHYLYMLVLKLIQTVYMTPNISSNWPTG